MLSVERLPELITAMSAVIQKNKDFLTELDMPIGDSDHGINLARGFAAVEAKLPTLAGKDIGFILKTVGMTLVSVVSQVTAGMTVKVFGITLQNENIAVASLIILFVIGYILFTKADDLNKAGK